MLNFAIKADHANILNPLIFHLELRGAKKILDAGSGRTSLGFLTEYCTGAQIDAVVFPGDTRKAETIKAGILNQNYTLMEMDLCKELPGGPYDIVLAHLLLGEAAKFGHTFEEVFTRLLQIKCKYLVVIDFLEDPKVKFDKIENNNGKYYKILYKASVPKSEPQEFSDFIGKTYTGYVLKMK